MKIIFSNFRKLLLPFLFILSACSAGPDQPLAKVMGLKNEQSQSLKQKQQFCWSGTLNNNIPVFLHYSFQDKVIVGEITYLNTQEKKPIKVIGTVEADTSLTLLEFEANGNNTGIITGKSQEEFFQGSLFSPASHNELNLSLVKKDTVLKVPDLRADMEQISGDYHYQFSEKGYQGFLKVNKLPDNHIAFSIYSVTEAPARNMAEVPTDTITMTGSSFRYKMPQSDSCEFIVTFYNGFATVDYTRGYCQNQFEENATVDGVFIKVK